MPYTSVSPGPNALRPPTPAGVLQLRYPPSRDVLERRDPTVFLNFSAEL
jgi:hypothetical protein